MKVNTKQYQTKNFKGVLTLLAGNSLSKLVLALGGFVLVNYYGPESYASYNVFLSYVMIFPVLTSFRLENIMILQKGSKEIRNVFSGTILVSFMTSVLFIAILALAKKTEILDLEMSYFMLGLCGTGTVLTAWNNAQNSLFTKFKLFQQMSTAFVLSSVFAVVFQIVFYFMELQENGLIYGWIVGLSASFIYNVRISKDRVGKLDFPLFKKNVKEHFEVVKYTYPSDSVNIIANYILPILAVAYFEKAEVGVFMLAFKILTMPLVLLSGAVSRVYFQKSVSLAKHDPEELIKLTCRVVLSSVGIIFLFIVLINTIGIYLLNIYLKDEWNDLGEFLQVLSFWILARSALNPIISILMVLKKNHYSLVFNLYLLLVNFVAIYFGYISDFINFLWMFSILAGIGYITLTIVLLTNLYKIKHNKINEK